MGFPERILTRSRSLQTLIAKPGMLNRDEVERHCYLVFLLALVVDAAYR